MNYFQYQYINKKIDTRNKIKSREQKRKSKIKKNKNNNTFRHMHKTVTTEDHRSMTSYFNVMNIFFIGHPINLMYILTNIHRELITHTIINGKTETPMN